MHSQPPFSATTPILKKNGYKANGSIWQTGFTTTSMSPVSRTLAANVKLRFHKGDWQKGGIKGG